MTMTNLRRAASILNRLVASTLFCGALSFFIAYFFQLLSTSSGEAIDVDLSNEESKRRLFNRLLYRSKQRGFLELDLVLGKWVDENIHNMDETGIRFLVDVLDLEDPDLWKCVSAQKQPPEAVCKTRCFVLCATKS